MFDAGTVLINFDADIRKMQADFKAVEDRLKQFEGQTKSAGLSYQKMFDGGAKIGGTIAKGIGIVGAALGGLGIFGLKAADDFEKANLKYKVLLKSAEKAAERMEEIKKFSAKTPFQMDDISKADILLEGFGIRSVELLTTIGDAAAISGSNFSELGLIIGQLSQSKDLENLKQLVERGVVSFEELRAAGIEFAKDGSVVNSVEETYGAVVDIMKNKFAGGMEELSNTLSGRLSTLKDNFSLTMGDLMEKSEVLERVKNRVSQLTERIQNIDVEAMAQKFDDAFNKVETAIQEFWDFIEPVMTPIINAIKDFFSVPENRKDAFIAVMTTLGIFLAMWGISITMAFIVPIAIFAAVALAVFVLVKIFKWFIDDFNSKVEQFKAKLEEFKAKFEEAKENVKRIIDSIIAFFKNLWDSVSNAVTSMVAGVINKFNEMRTKATTAVTNLANGIKDKFDEIVSSATDWGKHMMENFVSGIKAGIGWVMDAVGDLIEKIKDKLGFSLNPNLPTEIWGQHMIENFSAGIQKGLSGLDASVDMAVSGARDGFQSGQQFNTNRTINQTNNTYVQSQLDMDVLMERMEFQIKNV